MRALKRSIANVLAVHPSNPRAGDGVGLWRIVLVLSHGGVAVSSPRRGVVRPLVRLGRVPGGDERRREDAVASALPPARGGKHAELRTR